MQKNSADKKQGKIAKWLLMQNPGNLAKEVQVYGYHFSWKTHIVVILMSVLGIGAVGVLFQLQAEIAGYNDGYYVGGVTDTDP